MCRQEAQFSEIWVVLIAMIDASLVKFHTCGFQVRQSPGHQPAGRSGGNGCCQTEVLSAAAFEGDTVGVAHKQVGIACRRG